MNPIFKSNQHSSPNGQDSFSSQGECGTHTTNEKNIKYITDVSHYRFNTEKQEASLMGYIEEDESITKVVIPKFVIHNGEKYKVTSLGKECFMDCSTLTSIEIPESVTSLGEQCFRDCSALTSIKIPTSVKSLEWGCFWGCSALTSIELPKSLTKFGNGLLHRLLRLNINRPS